MLQVARLAPKLLLEAGDRVVEFLQSQVNNDGGGMNRSGESDLYYTVFVLDGLLAMRADPPPVETSTYVEQFGDGDGLDFVHLCCLARCRIALPCLGDHADTHTRILNRIEAYRSADGGYAASPGAESGTVYNGFLALGAYQDFGASLANPERLGQSVLALQSKDGAFSNYKNAPVGTTTVTAAAITLFRQLETPTPPGVADWLLAQCHPEGGFLATPAAPMPDLLSTATALHALSSLHEEFEQQKDPCLNFVDSLWTGRAFCGHWSDDVQDSEYTFYALLALGHLSL